MENNYKNFNIGDDVTYLRKFTGVKYKGKVIEIDKDGKYLRVRNTIGNIDYLPIKEVKKMEQGGKIGDTIRIAKDMPYMTSLNNLYNKDLKIVDVKDVFFGSGNQKYYTVEVDGEQYEVPGRFTEKKMKKGGSLKGNQKKLDLNKNGKLDAEDFKMLRGNKMAEGGGVENIITEPANMKVGKEVTNIRELKPGRLYWLPLPSGAGYDYYALGYLNVIDNNKYIFENTPDDFPDEVHIAASKDENYIEDEYQGWYDTFLKENLQDLIKESKIYHYDSNLNKMANGGGVESDMVYFIIDDEALDILLHENFKNYVDYQNLENGDVIYKMDRRQFERFEDLAYSTSQKYEDAIEVVNSDGSYIMAKGGGVESSFNFTKKGLEGKDQQHRIDELINVVKKNNWSSKPLTVESGVVKTYAKMYDLEPIRVASIFNKYQKPKMAKGGDIGECYYTIGGL